LKKAFDVLGVGPLGVEYVYEVKDPLYLEDLGLRVGDEIWWKDKDRWLLKERLMVFGELKSVRPAGVALPLFYLKDLGLNVGIAGTLGRDKEGDEFVNRFGRGDVTHIIRRRNTSVIYRILVKGVGRIRVLFPEDSFKINPEELDLPFLRQSRWVHLLPFPEQEGTFFIKKIKEDLFGMIPLSLECDSLYFGNFKEREILEGIDLLFVRDRDLMVLNEPLDSILKRVKMVLVNRGKKGVSLYHEGEEFTISEEVEDMEEVQEVLVGLFLGFLLLGEEPEKALSLARERALSYL
jgi:sugar/nucleoside kinase (ribokinase family)